MRRHSLDPDHIKRQIKSVFTSPTRKLRNLTSNHHQSSTNSNVDSGSIMKFARRTRRCSVPEKKSSIKSDPHSDLHPIDEVS